MVFLILESLGSTELLFILAMALVFFGPRKLPQLSRSLGKNIAEFRRASEDFKRTWDKEVSLEETGASTLVGTREQNSILDNGPIAQPLQSPTIEAISPDRVIARHSLEPDQLYSSELANSDVVADAAEPPRKREWL